MRLMHSNTLHSYYKLTGIVILSVCLHGLGLFSASYLGKHIIAKPSDTVVRMHVAPESLTAPVAEKVPDLPKKKPIQKAKKLGGTAPKTKASQPKPVQGITPQEYTTEPGLAVPVGNTSMSSDDANRVKDLKALSGEQDLSAQAQIIRSSVEIPEYTEDALDNSIEGTFAVSVYVDENGVVSQAELKRKIGYGMDEKVLAAARKTRFTPALDRLGKETGGWTEIKFRLQIP